MKIIDLKEVQHQVKVGHKCVDHEPNITEDSIFHYNGEPIGFYQQEITGKLKQAIEVANAEFISKRVPKSLMSRSSGLLDRTQNTVAQYSTIIGSVPPKPHMRRPYPSISSVHSKPKAKTFIKAMMVAARESEELIREILPEQFEFQEKAIRENVPAKYRLGRLFTSSISNANIAVDYHMRS